MIHSVRSAPRNGFQTHTPGRQPAYFLDRDGVLNDVDGFVNSPEDLDRKLMPEALDAVARLSRESDGPVVLITNQGGVGRHMTVEQAESILERLQQRIEEHGGRMDAIYYCPNMKAAKLPAGEVDARKPSPGMLFQAARDFGSRIDLADSYFVGDMTTDIAAGEAAEGDLTSVLVETGFAGKDGKVEAHPDHVSADLSQAVDWILARERGLS